ncbi:MAG: hypothetical protein K1X74_19710 [Pirellulales bacterium]|nr:hypothetical protein [Pirellulales bacterium]
MQVKIYVPKIVEIPTEYLPVLAHRASQSFGSDARDELATRGHLVRQAVRDGLVRDLDQFVLADGTIDLVCDPTAEAPLEIDGRTVTLTELLEAFGWPEHHRPQAAA